jgi:GH24 family phage-related lysozyme (muramidase)
MTDIIQTPVPGGLQILAPSDLTLNLVASGFIAYWEGFEGVATWDVNAYRLGFGSDTEGPEETPVKKGMVTTRPRALQNLAIRIPKFAAVCEKQLSDLWPKLGVSTQVACIDLAYNYGEIPATILSAFLTDGVAVADAIRRHDSDNSSVNRDRRAAEAGLVIFDGGQVQ